MFSRIGACSTTIVAPIRTPLKSTHLWCTRYGYGYNQTSAFFIGVILGTMLIAQKCRALIDATQASWVSLFLILIIVVITHSGTFLFCSFFNYPTLGNSLIRLEERGWMVSGAPPPSGKGAGSSTSVVVVKRGKKKMDHERYLDATQRYVPSLHISLPLFLSHKFFFGLIFARVCLL